MVRFEDREVRGTVSLWLISRLEGERSKGQKVKPGKQKNMNVRMQKVIHGKARDIEAVCG